MAVTDAGPMMYLEVFCIDMATCNEHTTETMKNSDNVWYDTIWEDSLACATKLSWSAGDQEIKNIEI